MEMTKEFDARNAEKSRAVCEAMAERADTGKRFLTERERRLLSAWPRHEGSGRPVWLGDGFADEKGELREVEGITLYSHGIDLYDAEGFHKGLDYGERLGRPAPVARDANGEPIHEGDTVYDARGERFTVTDIYDGLLGLSQYGFVIGSRRTPSSTTRPASSAETSTSCAAPRRSQRRRWADEERQDDDVTRQRAGSGIHPLRRHARKREGRRQRLWRRGVVQDRREERTGDRREVEGDRGVG